ncbi:TetR/AcrR family transcriptional regulator, partial [Rhodococcus erythropolis]
MSTDTRTRLVAAMIELMRWRGYSAVSVKDITVAARAPIGSLYHHFPGGKSQLAAAALQSANEAYVQLIPLHM